MLSQEEIAVLGVSLKIALMALAWGAPLAVALAYALSRPAFPGKSVLDGFVHLPLLLPPVLTGFLLLLVFGRRGAIGQWLDQANIHLAFTQAGAALATAVMILPLMVRSIRLSFEATDARLLEAAALLRAKPMDRFFTVALPLAAPGLLAGVITAFAAGLGEFGAVITFASNVPGETQTLPLAIYAALQEPSGEDKAMRLAAFSFVLALGALAGAELLQRWARARLDR